MNTDVNIFPLKRPHLADPVKAVQLDQLFLSLLLSLSLLFCCRCFDHLYMALYPLPSTLAVLLTHVILNE